MQVNESQTFLFMEGFCMLLLNETNARGYLDRFVKFRSNAVPSVHMLAKCHPIEF